MLNKLLLLFAFILFSYCVNSQTLKLQKNGKFRTLQLHLPKRILIVYKIDSTVISQRGKAFKYMFPYLYLKHGKDTLVTDVRKIEELKFFPSVAPLYYAGAYFAAGLTIGLALNWELQFAVIPLALTYLLIGNAHRNLDTKTKWSFY